MQSPCFILTGGGFLLPTEHRETTQNLVGKLKRSLSFPAILKIQLVEIGKNTEMNSRMTPHLWIKCSTLIVFTTVLQTACDVHAAPGPRLLVPNISDQPAKIRQVNTIETDVEEPLVARKPDLSIEARKPNLVADDATSKKSKTDAVPEPKPFPGIAKKTTPSMEKPKAPEVPEIVDPLDKLVDEAIEVSHRRMLHTDVHTPWQIAHGILALRWEYALYQNKKRIRAIDWISTGPSFRGRPWFITTDNGGKGHPFTEPYAFEGHPNQFLAFYGMAGIPLDHKINTGEKNDYHRRHDSKCQSRSKYRRRNHVDPLGIFTLPALGYRMDQ